MLRILVLVGLLWLRSLAFGASSDVSPSYTERLQAATTPTEAIHAHLDLSRAFWFEALDSMRFHATEALSLSESHENLEAEAAEALSLLAGVAHQTGHLSESLEHGMRALSIYESLQDSAGTARMLSNVAIILLALEKHEEGLSYSERALAMIRPLHDSLRLGDLLLVNAKSHLELGNPRRALISLKESQTLLTQLDRTLELVQNYALQSLAYSDLGEPDKAFRYAQNSISFSENPLNKLHGLKAMAKHLIAVDKPLVAIKYLKEAGQIAQQYGDLLDTYKLQRLLKEAYIADGDFALALYHDDIYDQLTDSIFTINKARAIASLQNQYALKNQVLENQILVEKQMNQEETMKSTRLANSVMGWLLALVFAGGLGLWFIYQRVHNLNRIMRNQREEILHTNNRLKETLEEINQQNDQIQNKNERLSSLNAYKDKLFSLISHDFRSPLASVISLLKVIENGQMTMEESKVFAQQVGLRVQHTFQLVSNLLYWSKTQMKGINPNPVAFAIEETLQEVYGVYQPIAQNKWVTLNMKMDGEHMVYADSDMTQTIIRNLISNAIKYTPSQGKVSVELQEGVHGLTIAIQDTGLGMDEETRSALFQDHVTSKLGTQNEKGTGIGLALCKDFIDKNEGKIWVESIPGEGSTFFLYLPTPPKEQLTTIPAESKEQPKEALLV